LGFRGTGAASVSTRPTSYPNLHISDTSILKGRHLRKEITGAVGTGTGSI